MRIAVQMDDWGQLRPHADTTLLLIEEAQARGAEIFCYTPAKLAWRQGELVASAARTRVTLEHTAPGAVQPWYHVEAVEEIALAKMDRVLMRQDPVSWLHYVSACHLLETVQDRTKVINRPESVRNYPEKLLPMMAPEFMPPTLITADAAQIEAFHAAHQEVVLKPLYGYGGRGVFLLRKQDVNAAALIELMLQPQLPIIVQKFLPEVASEERRIVLMNGQVIGAIARIPREGEIRSNLRVGGTAQLVELTAEQRRCCEQIGPRLRSLGLVFVGLDMIGKWVTEMNVTSPTGLRDIQRLSGSNPAIAFWDVVG